MKAVLTAVLILLLLIGYELKDWDEGAFALLCIAVILLVGCIALG